MYIEPNSNIKFYSGIPLDNTYENTLYWSSLSQQMSYFHGGIAKYSLTRNTYSRYERGKLKVKLLADDLYDCNYLAFQNESYGNKWFYAFITGVNYLNNETAEVSFEIDDMQTWYFDYTLLSSFVEREHTSNDAIGSNLVEEGLDTGEYVINGTVETLGLTDYKIVILTSSYFTGETPNIQWHNDVGMTLITGLPTGAHVWSYNFDNIGLEQANACVKVFSDEGRPDHILGIFLVPSAIFVPGGSAPNTITKALSKTYGSFNGYTPRNNKLYTYPYNFLYVTNVQGNSAVYPYEYFSTVECNFYAKGVTGAQTEIALFPTNYKGSEGYTGTLNKDEYLSLKGFPQCSYNIDTFKAWLAQNAGSMGATLLSACVAGTLAGGVGLLGTSGTAAATTSMVPYGVTRVIGQTGATTAQKMIGAGALAGTLQMVGQGYKHWVQPTQTRGNDCGTVLACGKDLDFYFMNKRIRGEYARIIDDFFTMYGYATKRVKVPNIHVRQRWTYTKTIGCNIKGKCPVDAISNIKRIFDKGVTFWVNPSDVGNYSLSNNTL